MRSKQKLLFPTNFSEACYQVIPAIAEWIDREQGELTILHVCDRGPSAAERSRDRLQSFFAEADRYARCERLLLNGAPATTIVDYCRTEQPDLVFAPASRPSGFPRFPHRSLRAKLVREAGVKLWTRGRSEGGENSPRVPKHVAYAVSGQPGWSTEALTAAQFARKYDATLHFLYMAPWPEVNEGTLAADLYVLHPNVAIREVKELMSNIPVNTKFHANMGDGCASLIRLLRDCRADVAFVSEDHAVRRRFLRDSMSADLDRLGCEVICYPRNSGAAGLERMTARPRYLVPAELR